jgi:hypothetical protein
VAQPAKLVHELIDARARRADNLGERLLADLGEDRLRATFLSEIREQEKRPRQPILAPVLTQAAAAPDAYRPRVVEGRAMSKTQDYRRRLQP